MESSDLGHYARKLNSAEIEKLNNDKVLLSEFKQNKLELEAKKNWDLFYKRNKTNFFKDRHWTIREFSELTDNAVENVDKPRLLEVGCGVGNFIFPLIEEKTKFFIYACDFSSRAIDFVKGWGNTSLYLPVASGFSDKENKLYNSDICEAFVCDVTKEELINYIAPDSIDIATMIFVLSAIHPNKMVDVLKNIHKVLKPGGLLLIRDYGLYDQAMLRFGPGHKLDDNFYVRQDGTRAYYFSEEGIENKILDAGFKVITNNYVSRKTVNIKENISVPRVYIQGKYQKPDR